jgi:hypothetical protein
MGGSYVRRNLRHLLPIWRCSFPRSIEEAKAEIQRGDAFTWECSLRSRAGAFGSMEAFVVHAGELLNEELLKQMVQLVEVSQIKFPGKHLFLDHFAHVVRSSVK